ncbi:hypothetical protein BHE74_00003780 [Ensete ventricosum]|nr:hypothetical protein BHE74_00003780 [Ensete ventricosum]RZR84229.1 hypothetical protein BHM03_00011001 [Ensete ventricosum]
MRYHRRDLAYKYPSRLFFHPSLALSSGSVYFSSIAGEKGNSFCWVAPPFGSFLVDSGLSWDSSRTMVSDASKKKAAAKKAAAAAKRGGKSAAAASSKAAAASKVPNGAAVDKVADGVGSLQISDRTCTGVLASHPQSRDIHVISLLFLLLVLKKHVFDKLLCSPPIESLSLTFHGHDLIVDSELELNYGRYCLLGFVLLFADLEACVWLEESLKKFDRILVVVSHSQDFLNGVCTNIIHMQNKKLKFYTGNYDQYVQTRADLEENQMKQYKWEQEQIASMKEYIARFGHGSAKLARQAQSKEKTLAKMERGGLTEKVVKDKVLVFRFTDVGKLPPPVLQFVGVTFGYTPDNLIYKNLDFGVDLDSRIALVGPNGAGKSTLLKLMTGDLVPLDGMVRRHNHLRIAQFHQHLAEKLDLEMSALLYMMREYPGNEEEKMRAAIGKFGLSGKAQVMPMNNLSDGQRSRVIFAWLAWRQPHLLLLDEPTNHLDIETIDSLAEALNEWDGGLVLVSHDFRLINQVAEEIWVCENQAATRWEGDIMEFKEHLRSKTEVSD